jgi:hypothetical protein
MIEREVTERVARAICGAGARCLNGKYREQPCIDGEGRATPCRANRDQLMLNYIWDEAEAAVTAMRAASGRE